MKCLVTGGCGFIGSHLVDLLIAQGHDVLVIDDCSTGRRENLAHLADERRLRVEIADIADHARIAPLLAGIDWVFHLAALADIVPSIQRPLDYHHANVDGTASILEASRQAVVKRFIYAASSSCYGIPDVFPTPESAEIRPQYPYAMTKWMGEQLALHWAAVYGLPVVSLRMFNVYGPRARTNGTYGAVFGTFLAQKLAGKPFTVVGDGKQTRDFTYVSDVVRAYLLAAESSLTGVVLNIGSGGTYSINHLVSLLGGAVTYIPKRPGEPDCTFADTTRIRDLLGWQPHISFPAGVERMLAHIDHWQSAPVWTPDTIANATRDWFKHLGKPSTQEPAHA